MDRQQRRTAPTFAIKDSIDIMLLRLLRTAQGQCRSNADYPSLRS
jgi:hypothetical protein